MLTTKQHRDSDCLFSFLFEQLASILSAQFGPGERLDSLPREKFNTQYLLTLKKSRNPDLYCHSTQDRHRTRGFPDLMLIC